MDRTVDAFSITLNSPMKEEDWDLITDVDFDNTTQIEFHTKHGKTVVFEKRREQDEPEINPCRGCEDYEPNWGCKSNGGCADTGGERDG